MPRKVKALDALLRDEFRRTIAFKIHDDIYGDGSMKNSAMERLTRDLYIGLNGKISHCKLFCNGEGHYQELWEYSTDLSVHTLRSIYTRSTIALRKNEDVTVEFMERKTFKSTELVSGRNLLLQSKLVQKNAKKALSVVSKYLKPDGTPKDSGHQLENIVNLLLDDMWVLLNSKNESENDEDADTNGADEDAVEMAEVAEDDDSEDDEDTGANETDGVETLADAMVPGASDTVLAAKAGDEDEKATAKNGIEKRKPDWFFPGFVAFLFFGPFRDNKDVDREVDFFRFKDPVKEKKKNYGRTHAREEKAKAEAFERSRDENRGMTHVERALVEGMSYNRLMHEKSMKESHILALNMHADRLMKLLDRANDRAEKTGDYSRVDKLDAEMDEINSQLKEAEQVLATSVVPTSANKLLKEEEDTTNYNRSQCVECFICHSF